MSHRNSGIDTDIYGQAKICWHMASATACENYPVDLALHGQARIGGLLNGFERDESIRRGGDGFVSVLDGGWLSLNTFRAKQLRPSANAISLYMRVWISPDGCGALFFSDFMALAVHKTGLVVGFLGVATPEGKTYREIPLGFIVRGRWLDLIVRVESGLIEFICDGSIVSYFPLRQELASPFEDELLIGAFKWSGPDLYGTATPTAFKDCKIDTVAIWDYSLVDDQAAFLCGVSKIENREKKTELDQALKDYNAFFDATIEKDIKTCGRLWRSLRAVADKDPMRPTYHLTQPLGYIFDPCGAYYYNNKYHVFSYRNIFSLLNYSSLDHYASDDLIHWSQWPTGPLADSPHDVFCIYLMNHFIDDSGMPRALYTGQGTQGKFGILARSEDGLISYTDKKAVLTKYHHDGHVWKEKNAWYTITSRMCRGMRPGPYGDAVMLWSSQDLEHWTELGEIFSQMKDEFAPAGFMEFPYLLSFGNREVLILGGHPVRYWVGCLNRESNKFIPDHPEGKLLDHTNPFHCYNPLCIDNKGPYESPRRIIMALYTGMQGSEPDFLPWNCLHAMPRSLCLESDHLCQEPLPEIQSLRGDRYSLMNVEVHPNCSGYVDKIGTTVEILAVFDQSDASCFGLKVCISADNKDCVRIVYNSQKQFFGIDLQDSAGQYGSKPMPTGFGPSYLAPGEPVVMHVFLDRRFIEVFVNGQTCTTAAPEKMRYCDGIDLFSEDGITSCLNLDIWDMNPSYGI